MTAKQLAPTLALFFMACQHAPTAATTALGREAAEENPPTLRLSDHARPTRYRVELTVVPTAERFDGAIDIDIELRAPTSTVWMNAHQLDFKGATVDGQGAKVVQGGSDFVGVSFGRALGPGAIRVHLDYSGEITAKASDGLFRQKEGDRWYVFTHFEPIDARRVFPCFDEPAFKTPWEMRLKVKQEDLAVANAPMVREEPAAGGMKVVVFEPTKPIPSYLVALGVGPFELVDAGKAGRNGTPVRIITPRGRGDEARFAKEVTVSIVERLEAYFGIPYPYQKLDIIDVPVIGGAMENPGLVTFAQQLVLSKPAEESLRFRRRYTSVAMHELAHQWFGDFVTTAWWDDIWLNEAFASWMDDHELEAWKPDWHTEAARAASSQGAMADDALVSARSIRQAIRSNDDMVNAFDSITYQKGEAVIAMFESWVGPERFRAGIHRYLEQHAFGAATSDDFLAAIDIEAKSPIRAAFHSFLDQPGVPVVSIGLRCEAGKAPVATLAQERDRPAGVAAGGAAQTWQIPVCVRYAGDGKDASACTLLSTPTAELPLPEAASCPAFLAGNDGQHGYYRVRYSGDLWTRVLDGADKLGLAERVGLLGDVGALVRGGKLPIADALTLAAQLASAPERDIVVSTIELARQAKSLDLIGEPQRKSWSHFVRATWGGRMQKLGLHPRAGEDDDTRLLRPALLTFVADDGEDEMLRKEARTLAQAWLADRKAIDPELVGAVLGVAALDGNRELFGAYVTEAKKATTTRSDRTRILGAIGSFRQPEIAQTAEMLLLSPDFDPREARPIVFGQLGAPSLRQQAYDFVKTNLDALIAGLSPRLAAGWSYSASRFCDEAHAHDAEQFFQGRTTRLVGGPRILQQAVETVRVCSAARALQLDSSAAFLKKY
jgi:alanyl aminopeptidase